MRGRRVRAGRAGGEGGGGGGSRGTSRSVPAFEGCRVLSAEPSHACELSYLPTVHTLSFRFIFALGHDLALAPVLRHVSAALGRWRGGHLAVVVLLSICQPSPPLPSPLSLQLITESSSQCLDSATPGPLATVSAPGRPTTDFALLLLLLRSRPQVACHVGGVHALVAAPLDHRCCCCCCCCCCVLFRADRCCPNHARVHHCR